MNEVKVPFPSEEGSWLKPKYRSIVGVDGEIQLLEDGFIDMYEKVQSYAESCDINNIVRRFMAGDLSALPDRQGLFMDATVLPTTRQAMLQSVIDAEASFYQLPEDVRASFDNSFEKFYVTAGSDEWLKNMASVFGSSVSPSPVSPDESSSDKK